MPEPARGMRSLGKMVEYVATRGRTLARPQQPALKELESGSETVSILVRAKEQGRHALAEIEAKQLLKGWGLRVPRGGLARSAAEARSLAASIGGSVAMKASSPDLLHKTEAGVVRLGVSGAEQIEKMFVDILENAEKWNPAASVDGVLVEEMIEAQAREVIVGVRHDLRFGPVVAFGFGGILVEALRDFAVWPAPLTPEEARDMIRKIRG